MAFQLGNSSGVSNGTTAVTVVASPSSGFRAIRTITLHQTGSTGYTSTLRFNNGSGTRIILAQPLQPGEGVVFGETLVLGTSDSIELVLSGAGGNSVQFVAAFGDET